MKKLKFSHQVFGDGFAYKIGQEVPLDRVHPVVAANAVRLGRAVIVDDGLSNKEIADMAGRAFRSSDDQYTTSPTIIASKPKKKAPK